MDFLKKLGKLIDKKKESSFNLDYKDMSIGDISNSAREKQKEVLIHLRNQNNEMCDEINSILEKLDEDLRLLKEKDITEKKADGRIKHITEVGRKEYIKFVCEFINNLREIEKNEEAFKKINYEIKNFLKNASKSYEKATYLIGDEAKKVKDNIDKIIKIEEKFLDKNIKSIKANESINIISEKDIFFKKSKEDLSEVKLKVKKLEQEIKIKHENLRVLSEKLKKVIQSEEAAKKQELFQKRAEKENQLNSIRFRLKTLFDLKLLEKYSYYEDDKNKKQLIKNYIENPSKNIMEDPEINISLLLDEIREKIENNNFTVKNKEKTLRDINIDKHDFIQYREKLTETNSQIDNLSEEYEKIDLGIEKLESEISQVKKEKSEKEKVLASLLKKQKEIKTDIEIAENEIKTIFSKLTD